MTEKSYFYSSGVTGDQIYAPYVQEEFNPYLMQPIVGYYTAAKTLYGLGWSVSNVPYTDMYVVPDFLDNLDVRTMGEGHFSVTVYAGAAVVQNKYYMLDASKTVPLRRPSTGYHRYDYVVVEQAAGTNEVRLAVVEGEETLTTDAVRLPALTTSAVLRQYPLARIYVTSANSYIPVAHVQDFRRFLWTSRSYLDNPTGAPNLLVNGGHMSISNSSPGDFDYWTTSGTYTEIGRVAIGRKQAITINPATATTLTQYIQVGGAKTFTVKVFIDPYSGAVTTDTTITLRGYRADNVESSVYKSQRYVTTDGMLSEYCIFTVTFPEDNIAYLKLTIETSTIITLYPVTLVEGYYPGGDESFPEILIHDASLVDAAWAVTAKSSGTTTINLVSGFDAEIENFTQAVILRVRGRDSGSNAAANCYMQIQGYAAPYNSTYGTLHLEGVTNDAWREILVIVPVNQIYTKTAVAGAQLRIVIVASGAAAFDATVEVVGLIA